MPRITLDGVRTLLRRSSPDRISKVRRMLLDAKSAEAAVRIALQLGVVHSLGAQAAQMYWVNRTPQGTFSATTLKMYKWLTPSKAAYLRSTGGVTRNLLPGRRDRQGRELVELNAVMDEVSRFARRTALPPTDEMFEAVLGLKPVVVLSPEGKAHLRDHVPFILFPIEIDECNFAVFKLKFDDRNLRAKLPYLRELLPLLARPLARSNILFGRSLDSLTLRLDKKRLSADPLVSISILSGPLSGDVHPRVVDNILDRIRSAQEAGVDVLHLDVMDGIFNQAGAQFVGSIRSQVEPDLHPEILSAFLGAVRPNTTLPIDVHLMVKNPAAYTVELMRQGVDIITISAELSATSNRIRPDLADQLSDMRSCDAHMGLAINPRTPVSAILPCLGMVDVVTVMSVTPGASGQRFKPSILAKVVELRKFARVAGISMGIQVDGGMNPLTARRVRGKGANLVAAASALYGQPDLRRAVRQLRGD